MMTDEVKKEIVEALWQGMNIAQACALVKVSTSAEYRARKKDVKYSELVIEVMEIRGKGSSRSKMTERTKFLFIEALWNGMTIEKACKVLGVNRSTEWRARQDDPKYKYRFNEARMRRDEMVEDALFKNALDGDVAAQRFFLINRAKKRWRSTWDQIVPEDAEGVILPMFDIDIKEIVIKKADAPPDPPREIIDLDPSLFKE